MKMGVNGRVALGIAVVLTALVVRQAVADVCVSTWVMQGVKLRKCPDGRLRQSVGLEARGLAREAPGFVGLWARAHGVDDKGLRMAAPVRRLEATLSLVDAEGRETPLVSDAQWDRTRPDAVTREGVVLPAVPDGDYRLRAQVRSALGTDTVETPLALYAAARVHVLTDRPLYEPGHQVRFRAVVLRAKDLSPLDGRPGTWFVSNPSGEVVLEQRLPAGPWGVVSGELPLDRGASTGTWTVRWVSGEATGEASFQVKPFTLPRFRVEAWSTRAFWRPGDAPLVEGRVVYSSGAPVANAAVEVRWSLSSGWPPPSAWFGAKPPEGLPVEARTDGSGRFRLALPRVPFDLRGQVPLVGVLTATDPAGEKLGSTVRVLLATDALAVSAVTELADGLAQGFNNRVYLRATTADGRLLPGAELTVKRAWDPRDEGLRAVTDEDGVAAFQLDPGPPVTVVVPAMPVRPTPRPPPVELTSLEDPITGGQSLADQLALERVLESLRPCARFVSPDVGSEDLSLGVRVSASGAVVDVVTLRSPLGDCLASALRGRALPAGRERVLSLSLTVMDPGLPTLAATEQSGFGAESSLLEALKPALLDARACLPATLSQTTPLPAVLAWRTRPGRREVEVSWIPVPRGEEERLSASVFSCVQSRLTRVVLEPSPGDALGLVGLSAEPSQADSDEGRPQDTTLLGYELKVSAKGRGEELGSTTWVASPAEVPPRRLRATLEPGPEGNAVLVELLRGPEFSDALPERLVLSVGSARLEAKVEREEGRLPRARFTLPGGFEGWAETRWEDVRARVYVPPAARLALEVAPDKRAYAPGELAHLQVRTWVEGKEGPAAVGLFGVDDSLAQLVSLPGPDALDALRPAPTLSSPAFDVLDGTALAMGRIRGANALAATLLRVSEVPSREAAEKSQTVDYQQPFSPEDELTEPFYRALAELTVQVRAWETSAPPGETLSPAALAGLWERALGACEARGEGVTDAFGRRLKLSRLPPELLALTAPQVLVVDAKRLSEDVENWGAWVAREAR